ncbi:RHS repeat-associated core domain-containing protein [Pseudomonas syringae]|uniref:RHS repeat-associated core domain-containing protein n=1 Tax=Pseudomonas syringae TaxID=317 RepID=UPI001CA8D7A3|nr:RHS repeat-associated core domain-containing protein [Pseudomonas syringae]
MSCLKSGVDPRTGLYNVSITLPELQSNDLRGPGFNLGLSYSQLNPLDSGYGLGWNLQLSQYDPGKQILSLSTGETFRVDGTGSDNQLTMSEKKLDTFHFYKLDDTRYRVVHKSGLVEILEVHFSGTRSMAWPVQIIAPSGHAIRLTHKPHSSSQYILESITDDLGETLLKLTRNRATITLELHPYAGAGGTALATFVMSLSGSDNRVSRITLPTENKASWRFVYGLENDQLCIKGVDTPSGSHEDIYYHDTGHEFPTSAKRPPVPRVTRHIIDPGSRQARVDVRYTYKDSQQRSRNFLGAGLQIVWEDNGLDNLYKYLGTYDYTCTESLWVDDKAVRSIERTYNRFHLQTLEVTTQNNHQQTLQTSYNILEGEPYFRQPNDCQLPRTITRSWQLSEPGTPVRLRSETVSDTYDSQGNLLVHTRADGLEEVSSWYPASGDDGCPPDPEGFVSRLREKVVKPAASNQTGAPTLSTRYRYRQLPALQGSESHYWIVSDSETLVHIASQAGEAERELQQTRLEYFDRPAEPFLHGRTERNIQTLNGKSTTSHYAYSKITSQPSGVPVLQIEQTLSTDFDSETRKVTRQQSALTGHELLINQDGVETRYGYDALNRRTHETVAAGTAYEASREYRYTLCANVGEQAEQRVINARKIMTRSLLDGMGRAIYEEQDHVDSAGVMTLRQIHAAYYNAWNTVEYETRFDWLDDQPRTETRRYRYDDWNQQYCVTTDDGVQTHQSLDPIGNDAHKAPIQTNWIQSSDPQPCISGRSETWLNLFGKPDRIASLDATGKELSKQVFLYDGLGRCTRQDDELERSTLFSYDSWSRMISTTLPDGSAVKRDYALHSSSELPIKLEVVHADGKTTTLAGEQTFDGLGRLTQSKVGERIETLTYNAGEMQVKSRKTAKGDDISFTYNLALTDQIVSSKAPDEQADFDYDNTSARLTRAQNPQGKRAYEYDVHNRLRKETWEDQQGKTWHTSYQTSLQERPLKRTDLAEGDNTGVDTTYHYDAIGRVDSIDQGNVQTAIAYDSLGQLSEIITRDQAANTAVVARMEYDDQGQETLRTHTVDNQPERTLKQEWQLDGLLKSRHLEQAASSLLHEVFTYDKRGRLTGVNYTGSTRPVDALGRKIDRQVFSFDELDNMTTSLTEFADNTNERATFHYGHPDDPVHKDRCQLLSIEYVPSRTTRDPTFSYDRNGNQLNDESDNSLHYDSQSRLLRVDDVADRLISEYRYDGHDHLVTTRNDGETEVLRFYEGQRLSSSVQDDQRTQHLHLDEQPLAQQRVGDTGETLLLLTDANQSVIGEYQQDKLRAAVYSAYGERHSDDALRSAAAFNGEVRESPSGWYLLGNGYRAYNPSLMRFHSPDFLSPFGEGGVNPYAYCLGNPIALRDPTGHDASAQSGRLRRPDEGAQPAERSGGFDVLTWVFLALGVAATVYGAYATVASFGAAAPVTVPVTVMGITTTATTASAVATGLLATGTALSAVATGATAYGAAKGDETANMVGMIAGLATVPFDITGGIFRFAVRGAVKAAGNATKTASMKSVFSDIHNSVDAPLNRVDSVVGATLEQSSRLYKNFMARPSPNWLQRKYRQIQRRLGTGPYDRSATAATSAPSWLARRSGVKTAIKEFGPNNFKVDLFIRG